MAFWPTSVATDAGLYIAVNTLQTTLSGSINSAVTTITLASTTGFPVAGAVTIDNEVIFYTGVSGSNLTGCVRGSDGTTAASHTSGVAAGATIVAYHHNVLKDEVIAIETSLNLTASKAVATNASGRLVAATTSDVELGYVAGVTSAIQTQLNAKAPLASPTFTGTVTIPTPFTLGAVSVTATGTEINRLVGVTSGVQSQLNLLAPLASPTFTGTVTAATMDVQTYFKGKGQSTNTAVGAGYIGEVIESAVTAVASGTTGAWADVTSISLTAGVWIIDCNVLFTIFSAGTVTDCHMGVSTTTGNSSTGLTLGDTQMDQAVPTAALNTSATIAGKKVLLSGTTTYYLKHMYTFSSGAYKSYGRITATRIA